MSNWNTIGYITDYFDRDKVLKLPFDLGCGIELISLPGWAKEDSVIDHFGWNKRESIKESTHIAFSAEYESEGLGPIQKDIAYKMATVSLLLWLVKPSLLYIDAITHFNEFDDKNKFVDSSSMKNISLLENEFGNQVTKEDLNLARRLNESLNSLNPESTIWIAVKILLQALWTELWVPHYVLCWIALESLFGPSNPGELNFRLSQRAAFFLTNDRREAKELFNTIKDGYRWRSKAVHGGRLNRLEPEKSLELLVQAENLIRKALLTILQNSDLIEKFNSNNRDDYLDSLIFNE